MKHLTTIILAALLFGCVEERVVTSVTDREQKFAIVTATHYSYDDGGVGFSGSGNVVFTGGSGAAYAVTVQYEMDGARDVQRVSKDTFLDVEVGSRLSQKCTYTEYENAETSVICDRKLTVAWNR